MRFLKDDEISIELASRVFEYAEEGICITDYHGKIYYVNPGFTRTTGYSLEEVRGQNPRILKSGRHPQSFYEVMWSDLVKKGKWRGQIWNKRKNGQVYPEVLNIHAVRNDQSETTHYVATFHEVTNAIAMRREIELASKIQRNTLRSDFKHKILNMKSLFYPSNHLSGDYYDYRYDEENHIFRGVLFDVMGHGVSTALQVSALTVLFRQVVNIEMPLGEKMRWMNLECKNVLPEGSFVGAMLFRFNLSTGVMTYVPAGINHFLVYSAQDREISAISKPGMYLGISQAEEFEEHQLQLHPGDGVVLLTDGFYDLIKEKNVSLESMDMSELIQWLENHAKSNSLLDDATALAYFYGK